MCEYCCRIQIRNYIYLLKKVLVGPMNSAQDPPKETQMRIATQTRCYPNPLLISPRRHLVMVVRP